jgi:hypothetical protein
MKNQAQTQENWYIEPLNINDAKSMNFFTKCKKSLKSNTELFFRGSFNLELLEKIREAKKI